MAGIDEVLERLVADAEFRAALARDPGAALAAYELTREDAQLLAGRLEDGDETMRLVEHRTSKSALLSFLTSFAGITGFDEMAEPGEALATPDGGGEVFNKSSGNVEVEWQVEEGELATTDVEFDDLTHKVDPGDDGAQDGHDDWVNVEPVSGGVLRSPTAPAGDAEALELEDVTHKVQPDDLTHKVQPDDLTHEVEPGDPEATEVELENVQVSSFRFGVLDNDAATAAGDPDVPIVTGRLPNAGDELTQVEEQPGVAVPGSDLMEPTEAEGEDEIPLMPNPDDLTHKVAPADGLATDADQVSGIDPTPFADADQVSGIQPEPFADADQVSGIQPEPFADADDVSGIDPQPFAEADAAMGDAGVDPAPGEEEGIIINGQEEQLAESVEPSELPDVDADQQTSFETQVATSDVQDAEELQDDVFEIGDA